MRISLATVPLLLTALATGCGSPKKDAGPAPATGAVAITLARGTANDIDVTIHVTNSAGNPVLAASPMVTIAGGTKSAVVEAGGGDYTTTVTPDVLDSEVKITAASADASATKIALAFANLDASLGQPETIDGLVNTPAWEDGVNVSPDGKWLLISTYVSLDALSCAFSSNDPANAACKTILGPVAAPARPGMLGASRIHGTTYDNVCPSFGITTPSTAIAFIPVAAYGFERQPDGSFANPFVIGWEADGCLGPYGMSLDGNTLYWMGSGQLFRSTLTTSADLKLAGSWSARQQLLGPATTTNILAAGEPTVAHVGGKTELYFVYIKKTPTGYDANAARVPMN